MNNRLFSFALSAIFLFSLILSATNNTNAQTTLVAGDIAFSGYIGNGTAVGTDQFSFVLLRNISSGTIINFTENGWLSTNLLQTAEFTVTWTANSALVAGQEIRISGTTPTLASGAGTPGTVSGTALSLSANGDQVLAYQGTSIAPTFIAGIHMNVYSLANVPDPVTTTAAAWDSTANTLNSSAVPTGLTNGTNAIWIGTQGDINSEVDNARFTCGTAPVGTVAAARAALTDQSNWTTRNNDAPSFTLPTGCAYLVVTAANVSLRGRVIDSNNRGISKARLSITNADGEVSTATTNPFGFYHFDNLNAGETYTIAVSSKRYQFTNPTRVLTISDDLTGVDFEASQF
jgi:hypothetical protein